MDSAEAPDPAASQRVPARIVLASIAALWLCYFGLATLRGWLVGLGMFDELLWRRAVVILASMAVTVALWPLLRLLDRRRLWIKSLAVIVIALPASLLLAAINQRVFAPIENSVTTRLTLNWEMSSACFISGKTGISMEFPKTMTKGTPQRNIRGRIVFFRKAAPLC